MKLTKVKYKNLNPRQKENYNFQKVAGKLADYGYNCLRLNDDWQGADFIACHIDGNEFMKVQLKGRFTIDNKYSDKDIFIAFFDSEDCYVFPHDEIRDKSFSLGKAKHTKSWINKKKYSQGKLPKWAKKMLPDYKI